MEKPKMETVKKRFSMHSTLKDAKIFEEDGDSWDKEKFTMELNRIKQEVEAEAKETTPPESKIKIKQEIVEDEAPPTPLNTKALEDDFSSSPFNRSLFSNFNIKQEVTPVKVDADVAQRAPSSGGKSVKRTIFTRNSPYKLPVKEEPQEAVKPRVSAKARLGPKVDEEQEGTPSKKSRLTSKESQSNVPERKSRHNFSRGETDPETLRRRQKQIDFGKNTVGYDNYLKITPKNKRTKEDPQTPNKYSKYSRRGWDGLIKQWRLKLHKYDLNHESESDDSDEEES